MPNSVEGERGSRPDLEAMMRLRDAVVRALGEVRILRERARSSEERVRRIEALLEEDGGGSDPGRIVDRLEALEEENRDLRERLVRGREAVDRMLARIRFLEEQR